MIHVFINALSASAGGGLTYIRNVLPHLANRDGVCTTLLVGGVLQGEIQESAHVKVLKADDPCGPGRRFWYEQRYLPNKIRQSGANVLLSTGNFALYRSPVPQILLSRNALYTSTDFLRDIRQRGDYRLWMDTKVKSALARWSVQIADRTVAPSATFAKELKQWTGKDVAFIYHGFDHTAFFQDRLFQEQRSLREDLQAQLCATEGALRVLFVSHYNYYRNFETLIRAIAILKKKLHPRKVRLLLTCKLASKDNPGIYQADKAADLVRQLKLEAEVIELGAVPYSALHHLYRACDVYATPAYAETFAHPLVEAMAIAGPTFGKKPGVAIGGESPNHSRKMNSKSPWERSVRCAELSAS
jgi:glycosyltransferase involved in cell wall biosynthesis